MLAADPDAGLEMFASMQPPLPPSAVLPMLTTYAPQLAGKRPAPLPPPLSLPVMLGQFAIILVAQNLVLALYCTAAAPYLEAALSSGAADPAVYEQELARIYLGRLASGCSSSGSSSGAVVVPPAELGKLKQLVSAAAVTTVGAEF